MSFNLKQFLTENKLTESSYVVKVYRIGKKLAKALPSGVKLSWSESVRTWYTTNDSLVKKYSEESNDLSTLRKFRDELRSKINEPNLVVTSDFDRLGFTLD